MPTTPLVGPLGAEGADTVSWGAVPMLTVSAGEGDETMEVCREHRASTRTGVYVPAALHTFDALVTPAGSQPESLPSAHKNRYCKVWPRVETAPLAV